MTNLSGRITKIEQTHAFREMKAYRELKIYHEDEQGLYEELKGEKIRVTEELPIEEGGLFDRSYIVIKA